MDVGQVATSLSLSSVQTSVNVGVLASVQNLDKALSSELFASLGLGQSIDAYA